MLADLAGSDITVVDAVRWPAVREQLVARITHAIEDTIP